MSSSITEINSQSDFSNIEHVWARRFFNAASHTLEPICTVVWCGYRIIAPLNKFDCKTQTLQEVALRSLYFLEAGILAIPAAALAITSVPLRFIGWMFQKKGYTHVRGEQHVKEKDFTANSYRVKVMTFNIAAVPAGISYQVAGMPHWKCRIGEIVKTIRDADPDVLVIQEAYDTAVQEYLVAELKDRYPHFFLHLGVGFCGGVSPGGVFMATKGAVGHFSDHLFNNNPSTQSRSFDSLELLNRAGGQPFARFIGTHPAWREDQKKEREQQWLQIQEYTQQRNRQTLLPTIIAADTNTERDREEGEKLKERMQFYYTDPAPTCWHRFPLEWKQDDKFKMFGPNRPRQIDNIILLCDPCSTKVKRIACKRIESYRDDYSVAHDSRKLFDTKTALSDHHAVMAEIEILSADKKYQ